MADSDGNPTDPNDPRYAVPSQAKPVAPAPRVNPPNVNSGKEAPPAGGPPGFTDFLEWMRTQAGGEPAAGSAAQRSLIPKERKKFQRQDLEAKADKPTAPEPTASEPPVKDVPVPEAKSAESTGTTGNLPSAASAETPPPVKTSVVPAEGPNRVRRQQTPVKRNSWFGLLIQLGMLILLAGSFLLGRATVSQVATTPAAPAAPEVVNSEGKLTTKLLSDANAALIDQAMAAEQKSEFKSAAESLGKVKASGEHVRGLTFQLAQLAALSGDYNKTLPLLNEALNDGEDPGDVYNLRATLSNRVALLRGGGMNDYETATKIDPFDARNFYYWGEALRRSGKYQAALVRLKEALDRLREPALESVYRLEIRLAQIETGQEKEFADELAKQLTSPSPPMDWLITAAAVEMHNGNFAAAAGYLDRAAQRSDGDAFKLRLNDYYLYQFRDQKELARFYAMVPQAKPGSPDGTPVPNESFAPAASDPPAFGLDVPALPPPASPGATLPPH